MGKQNEHFIYLDPHYVHNASKDIKVEQETYFCESFRKCKNTAIDSSVGICFYIRDIAGFNRFYKEIHKLKNENYEDFFIFVADNTPNYIKAHEIRSIQINTNKDDVFEILWIFLTSIQHYDNDRNRSYKVSSLAQQHPPFFFDFELVMGSCVNSILLVDYDTFVFCF